MLTLRYWNDPVLLAICDKIEDAEFEPQLEEFGRELIATMTAKNGVGLAAPQVGVAKRMFVMGLPDHREKAPIVVCNPTLVLNGGTTAEREGCLSLPNVYQQVYRAASATMQYRDPAGKHLEMALSTAWDARVAQHEFDHLNGIMFFDYRDKRPVYGARMSKQMSKSALREWEKVKKKGF